MINFNKNTAWNLTPINLNSIHNEVAGLMVNGERPLMAFKTIRDQLVFTNKRMIQTPGFMELVPDSELFLHFTNGFEATFEFRGNVDIGQIGRIISEYVLV